jgi:hypothetical protein
MGGAENFLVEICTETASYYRSVDNASGELGTCRVSQSPITECIKEVSLLLPHPCHFQNYDQSMTQLSSGFSECGKEHD